MKYGKPIIIRAYEPGMTFEEAAKLLLVSFDSTQKSNISVGLPLDLMFYERDTLQDRVSQNASTATIPITGVISQGWSVCAQGCVQAASRLYGIAVGLYANPCIRERGGSMDKDEFRHWALRAAAWGADLPRGARGKARASAKRARCDCCPHPGCTSRTS